MKAGVAKVCVIVAFVAFGLSLMLGIGAISLQIAPPDEPLFESWFVPTAALSVFGVSGFFAVVAYLRAVPAYTRFTLPRESCILAGETIA